MSQTTDLKCKQNKKRRRPSKSFRRFFSQTHPLTQVILTKHGGNYTPTLFTDETFCATHTSRKAIVRSEMSYSEITAFMEVSPHPLSGESDSTDEELLYKQVELWYQGAVVKRWKKTVLVEYPDGDCETMPLQLFKRYQVNDNTVLAPFYGTVMTLNPSNHKYEVVLSSTDTIQLKKMYVKRGMYAIAETQFLKL